MFNSQSDNEYENQNQKSIKHKRKRSYIFALQIILILVLLAVFVIIPYIKPKLQLILNPYTTPLMEEGGCSYARDQLSDSEKEIYDVLAYNVENFVDSFYIKLDSKEQIRKILAAYKLDHPLVGYIESSFKIATPFLGNSFKIYLNYTLTKDEFLQQQVQIKNITDSWIEATSKLPDYEKALYLHDKLLSHVTYNRGEDQHSFHTAAGAIIDGSATCEGYSKAYQYLMLKSGIHSIVVTGTAPVPHEWNIVQIDGDFYHIDCTFDDIYVKEFSSEYIVHNHFLLNDSDISKNHTVYTNDENPVALPVCSSDNYNYYRHNNILITDYTNKNIKNAVSKAVKLSKKYNNNIIEIGFTEKTYQQFSANEDRIKNYIFTAKNINSSVSICRIKDDNLYSIVFIVDC